MKGIYIISLIIPTILTIVGFIWATIPNYNSSHLLKGVNQPVEILWDSYGVPTIDAQSTEDAIFALGYITAQERLWQIDMIRRLATGRLSEVLGEDALELDKFFRTLGINRLAQRDLKYQKPETLKIVSKYVQGINSFVAEGNRLPIEYTIAWSSWALWTIEDSYAIKYFMGYFLDNHWGLVSLKSSLIKLLGVEAANQLLPQSDEQYPYTQYTILQNEVPDKLKGKEKLSYIYSDLIDLSDTKLSTGIGASNGWVISGKHTKSGKPIIAGDPHLTASIPGPLLLVNMSIKDYEFFSAAFLPGSIGTCSFINKNLAYTTTAQISLAIDLYMMKRNSNNPSQFLYDGVYEDAEIIEEEIKLKGGGSYNLLIENTRNGPIVNIDPKINMILSPQLTSSSFSGPIALKWVNYAVPDNSDDAMLCLFKALTVYHIKECFTSIKQVRLSFVSADSQGNILFQTAGAVPKRNAIPQGILEGWNPLHSWNSIIPTDQMPYVINPDKGYLVMANNPQIQADFKHKNSFPAISYMERATRITYLIEQNIQKGIKMTVEDIIKIQSDVGSLRAQKVLPTLLGLIRDHPIKSQLQNWDQRMDKNSNTAFIFSVWFQNIQKYLIRDEIQEDLLNTMLRSYPYRTFVTGLFNSTAFEILQGTDSLNSSRWCDDIRTKEKETCSQLVTNALDQAIAEVGQREWGKAHSYDFSHMPFGKVPIFNRLFNREHEARGSDETISAALWDPGSDNFRTNHCSMFRFVKEMGGKCLWNILPGQSGNVFSQNYDNLIASFTSDEFLICEERATANGVQTLNPDRRN